MKLELALITLLTLSGLYLFNHESTPLTLTEDSQILEAYQTWKSKYNKNFNGADDQFRFLQFKANYQFIEEHNKTGDQLKLAVNEFAAMNNEEFRSTYLMQPGKKVSTDNQRNASSMNVVVDWRKEGAVLPSKNQGNCGSCWAFSAIGGLEGLRYIVDGTLEPLSAQQLVSCIPKEYLDKGAKDGCGGSETHYAYTYTHFNGIETEAKYPYVSGKSGQVPECHHKKEDSSFYNKGETDGFVKINRGNVPVIKVSIRLQPLSVAVAAGNIYFQFYSGGILKSNHCGSNLDHAVLMVGMDDTIDTPYYLIQNSWGQNWGIEGGFVKIAITDGDGVCGVNMQVDYPTSIYQEL